PAHNAVCVDGLDQTPYRLSRPRGPVAQGRFLERCSAPGVDMLCGEARSPVYEAIHTRRILFVGNEYWIIADRLRGERRHRYDLRFHLSPEAWERTTATVRSGNAVVHAPGLALAFFPPFDLRIEPGWVAPEYGRKLPAPVVSVSVEAVDADFVTVVLPFRAGGSSRCRCDASHRCSGDRSLRRAARHPRPRRMESVAAAGRIRSASLRCGGGVAPRVGRR